LTALFFGVAMGVLQGDHFMDIKNSNLDKFFKVDDKCAQDGVDFVVDDKTRFRVRHFSTQNPRVKSATAKYFKPYARQIELGTLDPKKAEEITMNLFIEVSLVSWEGVEIDGTPVECTHDNALTLFKRLPQLFDVLWKHSNDFNNYKEELGNS